MKQRRISVSFIVLTISFLVIAICFYILISLNDLYNSTPITLNLTGADFDGRFYNSEDIGLEVGIRESDSAAWARDPVYDEETGEMLTPQGAGTIYEVELTNRTDEIISDWQVTVHVPEEMYMNNTWNGTFEIHQKKSTGEAVSQKIKLSDYSDYDIILDYRMENVGPMVHLDKGDYFVYYPSEAMGELPVAASDLKNNEFSHVKFGFIMYEYYKDVTYEADFTDCSVTYQMHRKLTQLELFYVLCVMAVIWFVFMLSTIIVHIRMKKVKLQRQHDEEIIEQTMRTFVNFIEAKDPNTMGHSLRVAQYTKMIAQELRLDDEECRRFYYIALMHDCGKLYIPDEILTKPSKLTNEEYAEMKLHTVHGKELLRNFTSISEIEHGALYHHEKYDGTGYPNGIQGKDIPLIARIIGICDAFDAMNSTRCYRPYLTKEYILEEIEKNRGKQFDPEMADILLKLINEGKITFQSEEKPQNESKS